MKSKKTDVDFIDLVSEDEQDEKPMKKRPRLDVKPTPMNEALKRIDDRNFTQSHDEPNILRAKSDWSNIKGILREYGAALITGVLDKEECLAAIKDADAAFGHMTDGGIFEDPKKALQERCFLSHGMLSQHHTGHLQASWDIRTNPKVLLTWEHIYPSAKGKFVVSTDGLSYGLPPEETGLGWHRKNWLHTDQGFTHKEHRNGVQSWVTACDVNEGDGTLQVLVHSHKFHKEFAEKFGLTNHSTDWYKLTEEQVAWYESKGCYLHNVVCPAGSQVLWDSRTIHAGRSPVKGRSTPNRRLVFYASYSPLSWMKEGAAKKKIQLFYALRNTTHNAHAPIVFPMNPRTWGKVFHPFRELDPPKMNKVGLMLLGFTSSAADDYLINQGDDYKQLA